MRTRLTDRRGDIAAVNGGDVGGGLQRQRLMQKRLRHVVGGDLAAEQVAAHVIFLVQAAALSASDHVGGEEAGADAVSVDGVGADAVAP